MNIYICRENKGEEYVLYENTNLISYETTVIF